MSIDSLNSVNVVHDETDKALDEQVMRDIETGETIDINLKDIKLPTKDEVARLARTSNIVMLTDEPAPFINDENKVTPLLIVARCRLDTIEYGAVHDLITHKDYVLEIVRVKGDIKDLRDIDGIGRDEEWELISHFFLDNNVYERNKIMKWIWNTKLRAQLKMGIPQTTIDRWEKKKHKVRTK